MKKYDVFISYRRDKDRGELGANIASNVKHHLERRGMSVFMDVENLHAGPFPRQIEEAISNSNNVVLILSPCAMDGCARKEDWVRRELEIARERNVLVTPIRHPDYRDPEDLPVWIRDTIQNEGPTWLHEFESAAIDRLLAIWEQGSVFSISSRTTANPMAAGLKPSDQSDNNWIDATPGVLSIRQSETVKSRLKGLKPSEEESASGFRVIDFGDDVILASDRLDDVLRSLPADGMRMISLPEENPFSDVLRAVDPIEARVLDWKRGQRGDRFHNEAKIGLASDLLLGADGAPPNSLSVFRTDYFSSFRTNEMATLDVDVAEEGEIADDWRGAEHFPWLDNPDGSFSMQSFALPGFSNHLGGNTLGVTDDGMLVLWIQSPLAERSQNRWAPTGSGSLDWTDLDPDGSFLRTIANGATRELREECRIAKDDSIRVETKVLGFYRWCGRGGLPGFLCASRIGCPASRLSPDPKEVGISRTRPLLGLRSARTREDLKRTVDELLDERGDLRYPLSTPLRANLLALCRALSAKAPELDFLFV